MQLASYSKRTTLLIALVLSMMTVGVAYAAWNAVGAGDGTATATDSQPLSITATAPTDALYPGAVTDMTVTITNPNPYAVEVTSIPGGEFTSATLGCATTGVTYTEPATVSIVVPANGSNGDTFVGAVDMDNSSDPGCDGADFAISLTLGGASYVAP